MRAVILAGGLRSTISEEQEGIPKPMIKIGERPLLWHIMKHFSEYDIKEFIVCGGYRIDRIKEYFMNFHIYESDITVDLSNNTIEIHQKKTEDWKVTVVDTGLNTINGKRVKMIQPYIQEEDFVVVYGDCLSDMDIQELIRKHRSAEKIVTMSIAKPTGREKLLPIIRNEGNLIFNSEKKQEQSAWINADCFVFSKEIFTYLTEDFDLERELLTELSGENQIAIYEHQGYWNAIETKRDLLEVEQLWSTGKASWIKGLEN